MDLRKHSFRSSFIVIYLLLISKCACQQNDDDDDGDSNDNDNSNSETCSFISGQGCLNGICKFCAMCIPSDCILGTPYSTGNNDGSTCAAIGDEYDGYDFYNYCLSTGNNDDDDDDDDDAGCPTSTICYQYQYSNTTHAWDKLTCDQDSCLLISEDGSPPPVPAIDTINGNITVTGPNTSHPISSKGYGTHHYYNELDIKSGSPASIALLTSCLILALCLVALLTRCLCRMKRVKRKLSKYFFFMNHNNNSHHGSIITLSPPPSFHSNIFFSSSSPQIMMLASNASSEILPDYDQNIPPKYEHAIVAQIRGLTSTTSSTTTPTGDETTTTTTTTTTVTINQPSSSSTSDNNNTVWIPVFVSPIPTLRPPNDSMNRSRSNHEYSWVSSHQDWATIQHEQ